MSTTENNVNNKQNYRRNYGPLRMIYAAIWTLMNLKLYFRFNFLPFLSEKNEEIANELLKEDDISYEESMNNDTYRPIVEKN